MYPEADALRLREERAPLAAFSDFLMRLPVPRKMTQAGGCFTG